MFFSKKYSRLLADSKNSCNFASLLEKSTSRRKFWRDGRVVDRGGLENRCTERYRGFESLSLRSKMDVYIHIHFFYYIVIFLPCFQNNPYLLLFFLEKGTIMNSIERKMKWTWVVIVLLAILLVAFCMHP